MTESTVAVLRLAQTDMALEYRWFGPSRADAPVIVMLHEGLGCLAMWKDFPERLSRATGLRILAYSRAGYGGSSPAPLPRPIDYMHQEGLRVLPALLDQLGLSRVVLLGHSDGGSIALIHAGGVDQGRVEALVLLAAHVFNEPLCVESIRAARDQYESGSELREKLRRYHGDQVDDAFRGWNDVWLDPGFRDWNIEAYLPQVRCPTLVIQGAEDQYGSLRQVEAIESGLSTPVRRAILPECRHSPHFDQAQATLDEISDFLAALKRPPGVKTTGSEAW